MEVRIAVVELSLRGGVNYFYFHLRLAGSHSDFLVDLIGCPDPPAAIIKWNQNNTAIMFRLLADFFPHLSWQNSARKNSKGFLKRYALYAHIWLDLCTVDFLPAGFCWSISHLFQCGSNWTFIATVLVSSVKWARHCSDFWPLLFLWHDPGRTEVASAVV